MATLSTVTLPALGTADASSNSGTGILADFSDVALTNGNTYTLRFEVGSNATSGNNFTLDNLSLNGVVPEPGSLALFGLGGLMIARRRRA